MSKEQAIAFFEELSKNNKLANEVEKVVRSKGSDEAKAKELISLAQRYNFNFTPEEAAVAQGSLKKPLSPEEMLEVSGGKLNLKSSLMALTLLAGLGVGGATLSNMGASAMEEEPSFNLPYMGQQVGNAQRQPATTGTQQQTTLQTVVQVNPRYHVVDAYPVSATNSTQRQTPPSNDQGAAQSDSQQTTRSTTHSSPKTTSSAEARGPKPTKEKKAKAHVEHDKLAAKRFKAVKRCGPHHVELARRVSASGALPAADWPAAPSANLKTENNTCRFCGGTLRALGKKARDVKCSNDGCIYNWVFPPTGDANLGGNQRGQKDCGHYARWALLPALILDSRNTYINSTGNKGLGRKRKLTIETPAEAWAVWQLIAQRRPDGTWPDISSMMGDHKVSPPTQDKVIELLNGSYANLGSEILQLVEGHNNDWRDIQATMAQRGYDATAADTAIERIEHAYNMLTNEQLAAVGIDPAAVKRNPKAALDAIESAHQQFKKSMQRLKAEQQQLAEEARQQAIEKLQHWEALSDDEKKAPGRLAAQSGLVKCRCQKAPGGKGCGSNNISFKQIERGGSLAFQCNACKRWNGATFRLTPDALLAMLQEAAPGNRPMKMVPEEENEQHLQLTPEIQPMRMNQGEGPTFALNFNSSTMLQSGMQGMNQFNLGQQMMQQNMLAMEMDDYEDNFDMGGYDDFDEDDDFDVPLNRKPKEVKERREYYENQEPYIPEPGMMGYQAPQQPMQMMNPNGFGFNFGGQDVNQINSMPQLQMNGQNGYLGYTQQNGTQLQQTLYGQFENQVNPPQQQMAPENWQFGFDNMQTNPLQMNSQQQNTQVDQNQQTMTYQPGLSFDPTQVLQQLGAQQNGTQPQQNLNPQPMLNLDLHYDPVGDYVNALNADTQELAQYTGMLLELINTGQAGNAAQLGSVVAAAQAVVNRVFARALQDQANQVILADERYLTAAQAFEEQLEIFNSIMRLI